MPSRKRSKGQRRKATDKALLHERRFACGDGECVHGLPPDLPTAHACRKFVQKMHREISSYIVNETLLFRGEDAGAASVAERLVFSAANAILCHPGVVEDDATRSYVIDRSLANGATLLLEARAPDHLSWAAGYAGAIMLIEKCANDNFRSEMMGCFTESSGAINVFVDMHCQSFLKMRDVLDECPRSIVHFYYKRLQCSCMDEMYEAARAQPKTGICNGCKQRKERRRLSVCSICRGHQYCSRR